MTQKHREALQESIKRHKQVIEAIKAESERLAAEQKQAQQQPEPKQ